MIELFEGRLGGGKTYSAVLRIVAALIEGRYVVTNIQLDIPLVYKYIREKFGLELSDGLLKMLEVDQFISACRYLGIESQKCSAWGLDYLEGVPPYDAPESYLLPGLDSLEGVGDYEVSLRPEVLQVLDSMELAKQLDKICPSGNRDLPNLIVLDEAHLFFNARDWDKTNSNMRQILIFLTQSRKLFIDLIFITQHQKNLDTQFTRLIQYVWRFRDMEKLKIEALGVAWPLKQILQNQFDYDGHTLMARNWVWKNKDIFALFNSEQLLVPVGRENFVAVGKRAKRVAVGSNAFFLWLNIAIFAFILWCIL